jgi:hypothetical protein
MHHKHYNQQNFNKKYMGQIGNLLTKGMKSITGTSKLAAGNKISQNNIQTPTSYWTQ